MKIEAVKVREKLTVRIKSNRLGSTEGWRTWRGLELNGKKFAKWKRPDREGEIENLMSGEKPLDVKMMERDG